MRSFKKKSTQYLLATLLVFALLVAPHQGEFWPFSIYPMFSKAGKPWTRALVRDVTATSDNHKWQTFNFNELQGSPVALQSFGIDAIDFANFVSKTDLWDWKRRQALQKMFGIDQIGDRELMVMKVSGRLVGQDSVAVTPTPLMLVTADTVIGNPNLPPGKK